MAQQHEANARSAKPGRTRGGPISRAAAGGVSPTDAAERVRQEVERAIQRNLKGLEFLSAPKQGVGAMRRIELARRGTFSLFHYVPVQRDVYRTPLLIVSPPSNYGYIFDLASGQSFVEYMLREGYDIYMIDWNPPRSTERHIALDHYIGEFISEAVDRVIALSGEEQVSLLGYCMGGTFALAYAALHPDQVRNLLLFTTPVDFTGMELFQNWAHPDHFDVDELVDRLGIIPAEFMLGAFDLMRPANRTAGVLHLWTNMWDDNYVRSYRMFDRWAAETLPLPGEFFRQMVKELMWDNALLHNHLRIGGAQVDLKKVTMPVLNIIAEHDHVVPYKVAHPATAAVGSDQAEEIVTRGGHVSVVSGPGAVKRLWPRVNEWLGEKSW